jgi:agmatine deiminase
VDRLKAREKAPRELGYRMPAEWEPHHATWLAWPHEETDWPGKFEAIPWIYAEIIRHLTRVERVHLLVPDEQRLHEATSVLRKRGANFDAIEFFEIPTDRGWTRDFGPIFVKRPGDIAVTNWMFNGWAKYDNWQRDDSAASEIAARLGVHQWEPDFVLEGGSIDVNGNGLLISTEECLLSSVQCRNPTRTREEIEAALRDYLGGERVLWLRDGIAGDDTHGHIDDLARFVAPDTIVTVVEDDPAEANYEPLQENLTILKGFEGIRIATLPMPEPVYFDGQRLPASYANFYIANRLVLVPVFNDAKDRIALNTLAELFPDREVVGIGATDLVLGLGTLHCMTQQQPAL